MTKKWGEWTGDIDHVIYSKLHGNYSLSLSVVLRYEIFTAGVRSEYAFTSQPSSPSSTISSQSHFQHRPSLIHLLSDEFVVLINRQHISALFSGTSVLRCIMFSGIESPLPHYYITPHYPTPCTYAEEFRPSLFTRTCPGGKPYGDFGAAARCSQEADLSPRGYE